MAREDAHRAHDRAYAFYDKLNESSIKSSEIVLRACLLINGGAAVSVLAFIGGLASKLSIGVAQLAPVADCLVKFAFGVVVAVAGMSLSYIVHYITGMHVESMEKIWEHPWLKPRRHTKFLAWLKIFVHLLAIAAAILALVLFVCGIFSVRDAIDHFPVSPPTTVTTPTRETTPPPPTVNPAPPPATPKP
jgi:hypothetical protein